MESPGALVLCHRRHGRRSRQSFFSRTQLGDARLTYSGTVGLLVEDTQSDLRRNIRSRVIRGQVNPVKDGGPLATRDLDWQDLSFLSYMHVTISDPVLHSTWCIIRRALSTFDRKIHNNIAVCDSMFCFYRESFHVDYGGYPDFRMSCTSYAA